MAALSIQVGNRVAVTKGRLRGLVGVVVGGVNKHGEYHVTFSDRAEDARLIRYDALTKIGNDASAEPIRPTTPILRYYAVQTITRGTERPRSDGKPHKAWQSAHATARKLAAQLRPGCLVDVVERTSGIEDYRYVARWEALGDGEFQRVF